MPAPETTSPFLPPATTLATARVAAPDENDLVPRADRRPEVLLAAVLTVVAGSAAWSGSAEPSSWVTLAVLPLIGLVALVLPGGDTARVLRAGALLTVAAVLAALIPATAPVALLTVLAVVALYPMLTGALAGTTITLLALVALAAPALTGLLLELLAGRIDLLADTAHPVRPIGLALSSSLLVTALIGGVATMARFSLDRALTLALSRERTARATSSRLTAAAGLDAGTGLPNLAALLQAADQMLATTETAAAPAAQGAQPGIGLMLIDLERFADLTAGPHRPAADQVASRLAERLLIGPAAGALLARVRPDRFALLTENATADSCGDLARAVAALMSVPVEIGGRDLVIGCSIGAALASPAVATGADLVQAADEAVREARLAGRARWVLSDPELRAQVREQTELENELRELVRGGGVEVLFQPVLGLAGDEQVVGVEAVTRWTRANGSVVAADRLRALADELGIGLLLGMQVIQQALDALASWRQDGVPLEQVWVDLAADQLADPEFAHEVAAQLAIRGLPAAALVLQVPAGPEIANGQPLTTLTTLRSLGIALALDGFGSSGSSLSDLHRLPIGAIKLDPTLTGAIRAIGATRDNGASGATENTGTACTTDQARLIAATATQLCRTLGLRVVVEQVDSPDGLQTVRQLQADAAQGSAVARPLSRADLTDLITLRSHRDLTEVATEISLKSQPRSR